MARKPIPFFMDNCVADSVGKMLEKNKHDVVRLREVMRPDTKDPVVAISCIESARVLVTHDKDFKALAKRINVTQRQCNKLHKISLLCTEPQAAKRMEDALSIIEAEWKRVFDGRNQEQMDIQITNVAIRIIR